MERREVSFRIQRYNPQVDRAPFYDNFRIAVEKGITILRALNYIKEHLEPCLTFRAFCQAGICGSCAIRRSSISSTAAPRACLARSPARRRWASACAGRR